MNGEPCGGVSGPDGRKGMLRRPASKRSTPTIWSKWVTFCAIAAGGLCAALVQLFALRANSISDVAEFFTRTWDVRSGDSLMPDSSEGILGTWGGGRAGRPRSSGASTSAQTSPHAATQATGAELSPEPPWPTNVNESLKQTTRWPPLAPVVRQCPHPPLLPRPPLPDPPPIPPIPATEFVVSIPTCILTIQRAVVVVQTWARFFEGFEVFTFDNFTSEIGFTQEKYPWLRHVDKAFSYEKTRRATGINLVMVQLMYELYPKAKWYVQADDDTLIIPHNFIRPIRLNETAHLYVGSFSGYKKVPFAVGGSGFYLSQPLVKAILPYITECRLEFNRWDYGDARVGGCIRKVFGPNATQKMVVSLLGAENNKPLRKWMLKKGRPITTPVLSLHIKSPDLFRRLWKHIADKVERRVEVKMRDIQEYCNTSSSSSSSEEAIFCTAW